MSKYRHPGSPELRHSNRKEFGKIPELDLKNITEIYRAEYQEKQ